MDRKATVGIAGGTCAGKTTLALAIQAALGTKRCVVLAMDDFYLQQPASARLTNSVNFERPEAIDGAAFVEALRTLQSGNAALVPNYDRALGEVVGSRTLDAKPIIIVEGVYALHDELIVRSIDLAVFLEVSPEVQLARRLSRDLGYGLSEEAILRNYSENVQLAMEELILPTKSCAELTLATHLEPDAALKLCLQRIERIAGPAKSEVF